MTPHITRKVLIVAVMGVFIGAVALVFALSPKTPGPAPESSTAAATATPTTVVPAEPAQPAESTAVTAPSAPLAAASPPAPTVATTTVETKSTHERKSAGTHEPTGPAVAERAAPARQANADDSSRSTGPTVASEAIPAVTPELLAPPVASDNSITNDVKSQFAADSVGKDVDIGVTTTQGAVVLTGTLASQDAIEHVKGVAERVKDVKSVDVTALQIASL
jgi:hyperosmotically inducible protein